MLNLGEGWNGDTSFECMVLRVLKSKLFFSKIGWIVVYEDEVFPYFISKGSYTYVQD